MKNSGTILESRKLECPPLSVTGLCHVAREASTTTNTTN